MASQAFGRRKVLKRGAGLGLAASAVGLAVAAAPSAAQDGATPSASDESDIEKLKADVRAEYDRVRSELEALGADVTDDSREAYDTITSGFAAIDAQLSRAEDISHEDLFEQGQRHRRTLKVRAYREVQHALEDLDLEAHVALHKASDAGQDTWHETRKGIHDVHKKVDHVIDAL